MKQSVHVFTNGLDLSVDIGSLHLNNPIITASGTFGSGREFSDFINLEHLGAIVTKGVSLNPWLGNQGTRIVETSSGMLNSIGLQNPGVEAFCTKDLEWLAQNAPQSKVIVNVSGHSASEYVAVIERLESEPMVAAYEINISCPNVDEGGLAFGTTCHSATAITAACRAATTRPIMVKLSPNVTDITEIARAVESAGADSVSLINTLLGMAIDAHAFKPKFKRVVAGLSGPAIKPVALRMVYQVAQAVSIPVVGMGGVVNPIDVVEFMLAGATAVAVGTANFVDPTTTMRCIDGLESFCKEHDISRARDLIGALKDA